MDFHLCTSADVPFLIHNVFVVVEKYDFGTCARCSKQEMRESGPFCLSVGWAFHQKGLSEHFLASLSAKFAKTTLSTLFLP